MNVFRINLRNVEPLTILNTKSITCLSHFRNEGYITHLDFHTVFLEAIINSRYALNKALYLLLISNPLSFRYVDS